MRKIKKGDEVIVLVGKSRGTRGKVIQMLDQGRKVLVAGANIVKKHIKGNPQRQAPGGISKQEAPIAISNVALYNPITKRGDRVGVRITAEGKKVRYFKTTNELVEV